MDESSKVRYLSGGASPDRYLAVEWHRMTNYQGDRFTFQAVLWESGNIDFQYQSMTYTQPTTDPAGTIGIEDSFGYYGLQYWPPGLVAGGTALRFVRPAPSARLRIWPPTLAHQGQFTANGQLGARVWPGH
ncbi:MAG: hypothetical protein ACUVWR_18230 [Anaerolineae bacterium]